MKPILIGLHGKTGVGKDTICDMIRLLSPLETQRLAFGDALKACARAAFSLSEEWLQDDHKSKVHPYWNITPREMFQLTGTDAFRTVFGSDFWVRRLNLTMESHMGLFGMYVITDVRYNGEDTESRWVRESGGVVVHVRGPQRRGDVNTGHVSNVELPVQPGDYIIENVGSLADLRDKCRELITAVMAYNNPNKEPQHA